MIFPDILDVISLTGHLECFGHLSEFKRSYKPCRTLKGMYLDRIVFPISRYVVLFKFLMLIRDGIIEYLKYRSERILGAAVLQGNFSIYTADGIIPFWLLNSFCFFSAVS